MNFVRPENLEDDLHYVIYDFSRLRKRMLTSDVLKNAIFTLLYHDHYNPLRLDVENDFGRYGEGTIVLQQSFLQSHHKDHIKGMLDKFLWSDKEIEYFG